MKLTALNPYIAWIKVGAAALLLTFTPEQLAS